LQALNFYRALYYFELERWYVSIGHGSHVANDGAT